LPIKSKGSYRVVGSIVGLVCAMGLITVLVNRLRYDLGLAVASVSFVPALTAYFVAWLVILFLLPRATADPGALLPGAALIALTITTMHAMSELYLADRVAQASVLYGDIGTTIVTLGWFFILGRVVVIAMSLNSAVYDRLGSVSTFVFSLPAVRILPAHSARIRRFFELDNPRRDSP
jgi:uncharacterized BrkB/YihY/UPF0761 family membrane protein